MMMFASAYAGQPRPTWDPFTDCEFTRENPCVEGECVIEAPFVASDKANNVYVWARAEGKPVGESVSLIIRGPEILDDGLPRPAWEDPARAAEDELTMYNAALALGA
jgi:hypothetical protein